MTRISPQVLISALLIIAGLTTEQGLADEVKTALRGPYLGQPAPGLVPQIFAPGVVSTEKGHELNAVFSADGREFYFAREVGEALKIFVMHQDASGLWSQPEMASFSKSNTEWDEVDMWFSMDGKRLYYISNAPAEGRPAKSVNIWQVARKAEGWGHPKLLTTPVNSDGNELYPVMVESGRMYFASTREGSKGDRDVYFAEPGKHGYARVKSLGDSVNTEARESDMYVAPDESYMILTARREAGHGGADLYLSYRDQEGSWSVPRNLGEPINSADHDYSPVISHDGRYFFFTRGGDLYWVDAKALRLNTAQGSPKTGRDTEGSAAEH